MPVRVDQDTCIGCGACTGVCPTGSMSLDDSGKATSEASTCVDCGACVGTCPVSAITQE